MDDSGTWSVTVEIIREWYVILFKTDKIEKLANSTRCHCDIPCGFIAVHRSITGCDHVLSNYTILSKAQFSFNLASLIFRLRFTMSVAYCFSQT